MDGMLDSLLNMLQKVEYQSEYSDSKYMSRVISEKHMPLIKAAVVEWYDMYFSSEYARKIGELEAKVYTYEQIIANSNFAPILQPLLREKDNNKPTEYPICPQVDDNTIPRCVYLVEKQYCSGKVCER